MIVIVIMFLGFPAVPIYMRHRSTLNIIKCMYICRVELL